MARKTNKKEKTYFKVDPDKVFDIIDTLRKKGLDVQMVTVLELKVTWLVKQYSLEDIQQIIDKH